MNWWVRKTSIALVFVMVLSALMVIPRAAGAASAEPVASAASPLPPVQAAAHAPRELKMGWIGLTVGTLNPMQITLSDEYVIVYNVYSTLITFDRDNRYFPDLARKWAQTSPTTWEFWIVPNAYFVDPRAPMDRSHPVTGADVAFSYNLYKNNVNKMGLFTDYVRNVVSASVDPTDPLHVSITFDRPYAPAMDTFATMFIIPQYIWSVEGFSYANYLPIGSGPFMVRPDPSHPDKMLKPPPVLFFDKNPLWFGPWAHGIESFVDTIDVEVYTNSAAMSQDLVLGVIDVALSPEPTEWLYYLKDRPGVIRQSIPHAFVGELAINMMTDTLRATNPSRFNKGSNNPVLQNQVVRAAIHMSTNRTKMVNQALLGLGEPADTLVPKVNNWHYDYPDYVAPFELTYQGAPNGYYNNQTLRAPITPNTEFPDDTGPPGVSGPSTRMARQLLWDAGWRYDCAGNAVPSTSTVFPLCKAGGTERLEFRFATLSDENWWKTAAEGVVEDAKKSGIQLDLALYNTNQMNNQLWWPLNFDIYLWDWLFTPVQIDPSTGILSVETCENLINGTANDNGFCLIDPATGRWYYDDLYNKSITVTDPVARRAITDEMQRILYQYAAYNLPFYRREVYAMTEVRWTNWGDWAVHSGLLYDITDLPTLAFQVWPVDQKPPQVPELPDFQGIAGSPIPFSVVATDPEGKPLTYSWDFDDRIDLNHDGIYDNDTEATTAAPMHTYLTAGVYNVTVRVTEDPAAGGEWFTVRKGKVTVYDSQPPGSPQVRGFRYSPDNATLPAVQVSFGVAAMDPQGQTLSYSWNFGDGSAPQTTSVPSVDHVYSTAGIYTVTVTATNTGGSSSSLSTILQVYNNVAPVVQPLSDQMTTAGTLFTTVAFARDENFRDTLAYSWDFGDGSPAVTGNPATHIYSTKGNQPTQYLMTVTVTDTPGGHSVSRSAYVNVLPAGPDQAPVITDWIVTPNPGYTTQTYTYTVTAYDPDGNPLHWSFDVDGVKGVDLVYTTPQTPPGKNQTFAFDWNYPTPMPHFFATVWVDDLVKWNQTQKITVAVYANDPPTLSVITAVPTNPIPNELVTFTATSADLNGDQLAYTWTFGDGASTRGLTAPSGGLITATHPFAAEGTYQVVLTVDDQKGGLVNRTYSIPVVAVNRPPTLTAITAAPLVGQVGQTFDFSATAADPNGDVLAFTWNYGDGSTAYTGTAAAGTTLTASHAYSAIGTYTVSLSVDDQHGGTASRTVDVTVQTAPVVDTTPPVTTHGLAGTQGSLGWYKSAVTVTLTATDDISGVARTEYRVNGGAWEAYSAPFVISTDGTNTLEYNSTDFAGNHEATHTASLKIDTLAPASSASLAGTAGLNGWYTSTSVSVTLTGTDATSGLASVTYRIDGGTWQTYASPFPVTVDGVHMVDYFAGDFAGWSESTKFQRISIDSALPATTLTVAGTAGTNGWYTSPVTVTLVASDAASGVSYTQLRLDGGAWQTYSLPLTFPNEGTHSLEYNSTDIAGNAETTSSAVVKNDTVAPVTTASVSGTAGPAGWFVSAVTVTLTVAEATSGVASTQYRIDGGTWQAYSVPFAVSSDGTHTVGFMTSDLAGNPETAKSATVNIDTTSPSTGAAIAGTAGANGWFTSAVTVTLTGTDPASGVASITYTVDSGSQQTYSAPFAVSGEGTHTVAFTVTDNAGHVATNSVSAKIDTQAPTAALAPSGTQGDNGWYTGATSFTLSGSDATSGVAGLSYRVDGGAWQTYASSVALADGSRTVEYRATDNAGTTSAVASATIKVDTSKPVLTGLGPTGTLTSASVEVKWTGSDAVSGIAGYQVTVDGGAAQSVSGTSLTLSLGDGDHTVEVTAKDNAGNTQTAQTSFRVDTNAFSLSGPYGGLPLYAIIVVAVVAVAVAVLLLRRRKKSASQPPETPPETPPEP